MKYRICDWEDNGYHDSYFYGVTYDDATGKLESAMIGATAYASGAYSLAGVPDPTREVLEAARIQLRDHIFQAIRDAEHADTLTPQHAQRDDEMILLENHRKVVRAMIPCEKCLGKGYWQNPRNPTDKRPCFACEGKSEVPKGDPVKDAAGKQVYHLIPAGTRATVLNVKAFGSFFRKGYNRPDRTNRSVTVRLADGHVANIPMAKLRRANDPMSDAELMERAETLSHEHQYGAMFGCRGWLSENYAAAAAKRFAAEDAGEIVRAVHEAA